MKEEEKQIVVDSRTLLVLFLYSGVHVYFTIYVRTSRIYIIFPFPFSSAETNIYKNDLASKSLLYLLEQAPCEDDLLLLPPVPPPLLLLLLLLLDLDADGACPPPPTLPLPPPSFPLADNVDFVEASAPFTLRNMMPRFMFVSDDGMESAIRFSSASLDV